MKNTPTLVGSWVRFILLVFILATLIATIPNKPAHAKNPLGKGQLMPDLELPMPGEAAQASYLGLEPGQAKTFRISQIKKDWLLVEIFNMYCTICQGEAHEVNQLYQKIRQSPLNDQLAMIGIGVGNSPFEVNVFRNRYRIEFPLFPDMGYKVHKALGEPYTPHFVLVRLKQGELRIFLSNMGSFGQPSDFLADLQNVIKGK